MEFHHLFSFYLTIITLTTISLFHSSKAVNPIILPIFKDTTKPQYYTTFLLGTPSLSVSLAIDLSSPWSWFTCNLVGFNDTWYSGVPNSSTYRVQRCTDDNSCAVYDSNYCYTCNSPNCKPKGNMCTGEIYPPSLYTGGSFYGGHLLAPLLLDIITVYKSNGPIPLGKRVYGFSFGCTGVDDLKGLSRYTKGVLSLARKDSNSFHGFITKAFKIPNKFALCLPSASKSTLNGAMYFGGGPYKLPPSKLDLSQFFVKTALVVNPIDVGETYGKRNSSIEYFVNIKSILVDDTPLKINSSLLVIDKNGLGGTKINPIYPYTTLHTNIYNALVDAFTTKAATMNITRVGQVSSFSACFSSKNMVGTKTGPKVPIISLKLDGRNEDIWRFYGFNSMIKVSNDVRCLAIVDGGLSVKASIVIGGKQMEDSLVEFDLESSKLRVMSSLLRFGTSCSQFRGA
ncbi:putative aspartic proteinase GIP2 [Silene latifolia]|uniref:putative aspartic proteinase GIP2 n=1 Tax=Silene latifolia TaxID=37657 RepID=UPI003D77159C